MKPWKFLTNAYVEAICSRERFPVLRPGPLCVWVSENARFPSLEPTFDVGLRHDGATYIQEADRLAWRRADVNTRSLDALRAPA